MPIEQSQYIFGNSLVNFAGGNAFTNVPYWMDLFAEEAGNTYAANGAYGFLREFADRPEPLSQWGFSGVDSAWESGSFADAEFDSVLITPANFIQDLSVDINYFGDSRSPLDAVQDIVADVTTDQPDARIFIYQGWADMGPYSDTIPPSDDALRAYHDYNMGGYNDWYETLVDQINAADPDANVTLIPVASTLSELFTTVLSDIPADALYVDSAPHGTETTYYLASMITYMATYGERPPQLDPAPDNIHPSVLANHEAIVDVIEENLIEAGVLDGNGTGIDSGETGPVDPEPVDPEPVDPEPEVIPEPEPEVIPEPEPEVIPEPEPEPEPEIIPEPEPEVIPEPEPEVIPEPEDTAEAAEFTVDFFNLNPSVRSIDDVDFSVQADGADTAEDVDFFATTEAFADGAQSDNVATVFTKTIDSAEGGVYRVDLQAEDEAQLYVNGELILDSRDVELEGFQQVELELPAGEHTVEIRHLELRGEASLRSNIEYVGPLEDTPDDVVDPEPETGVEPVVDTDDDDVDAPAPEESGGRPSHGQGNGNGGHNGNGGRDPIADQDAETEAEASTPEVETIVSGDEIITILAAFSNKKWWDAEAELEALAEEEDEAADIV